MFVFNIYYSTYCIDLFEMIQSVNIREISLESNTLKS